MPLSLTQRDVHGHCVLELYGELDLATAPRLRRALLDALRTGSGSIALDLRELRFMDSSGLSVILGAHRRARHQERDLVVVSPNSQVRALLRLTETDRALTVRETLEPATTPPPSAAVEAV